MKKKTTEWDDVVTILFSVIEMSVLGTGAFWLWPEGITDTPLASLTLGALLKAAGAVLMGIALVFSVLSAALR